MIDRGGSDPDDKERRKPVRRTLRSKVLRWRRFLMVFIALAACFSVWVIRTYLICGFDSDCWMGDRVQLVETSKLSPNYDSWGAGQPILVYDSGGVRTLKFGSMESDRQSSAVIGDPDIFTLPIHCHIAGAIFVFAERPPKRVLMFGMGGGGLHSFVQAHFPEAHMDVIDMEPEVVRIAFEHFNVRRTPNLNVTIADGRKWLDMLPSEGLAPEERYDMIVQDACAGHPCSLVTVEAIAILKERALAVAGGVFIQNLFSVVPAVVRTFQQAFSKENDAALYSLASGFSSTALIGLTMKAMSESPSVQQLLGRARFLKNAGLGPKCYARGLRKGLSDDIASMMMDRLERADVPLLNGQPITDSNADVIALEEQRWGKQ